MQKYVSNLKARKIVISSEDRHMVSTITESKLQQNSTYARLPSRIKDIVKSNVLIVATTDSVKNVGSNKVDVIIGNIKDAIALVMADVAIGSAYMD